MREFYIRRVVQKRKSYPKPTSDPEYSTKIIEKHTKRMRIM